MRNDRRIELVVTDGKRSIRSFWLEQRRSGVFGFFITPRLSMHRSYHLDGNVHYRVEGSPRISNADSIFNSKGYSKEVIKAPQLNAFKGSFEFFNGGLRLDNDVLNEGIPYKFKKVDNILTIDTRNIEGKQKQLTLLATLVEPHQFNILQKVIETREKMCRSSNQVGEYHIFNRFNPWVLVFLMFSTR